MISHAEPASERLTALLRSHRVPRLHLMSGPTSLVRLAAFSHSIGIETWMKRDDMGSIALAGNKIRKLEFTIARAQMDGATVIVCVGPQQSNSVRATASASAMVGLRCVAVLEGDAPDNSDGNLLIDRLVGAEIHFSGTHDWDILDTHAAAVAADLTGQGERVYILPMSGSVPLGSLGFTAAYAELLDQADAVGLKPTAIVHASSTGGSHAGLELGQRLLGGPRIQAMGVAKGPVDLATRVAGLAQAAAEIIGVDERWTSDDVTVDPGYLGPAYGVPTEACLEAIQLLARTEAILCDPVYSGKALAGLIDYARSGNLDGPVVFWHTGGALAIFTHRYAGIVDRSLETGAAGRAERAAEHGRGGRRGRP